MAMELVTQLPYDHPYRWDGTAFGGPKLWQPSDIGSILALWLDAADTSTITLNGSTVSQWNDKSGNGRNAVQATAANQPTFSATGLNSFPTLDFDGTDFLQYSSSMFSVENVTALCVMKEDTEKFYAGVLSIYAATGSDENQANSIVMAAGVSDSYVWGSSNSAHSVVSGTGAAPASVWAYRKITASITAYRNATAAPTVSVTAAGTANGGYLVGNRWQSSAVGSTGLRLDGKISEIVVLSRAVTTDEFDRLNGYLAWKWGLQADLPVSHPYYNLPPTV